MNAAKIRAGVLTLILGVWFSTPEQASAQKSEPWPEAAEGFVGSMSYKFVAGGTGPNGDFIKPSSTHDITVKGLRPQAVFSGNRVHFGPFNVSTGYLTFNGQPIPNFSATFTVRVLGRSPQQINPLADLTELGRVSRRLVPSVGKTATDSFYVSVTLPGALTALAIEATIGNVFQGAPGVSFSEVYPADGCKLRLNGDRNCLQAGVNPLGVTMALVPLSIVYEPPGQCSFAELATSETTSINVSIDHSDSKTTQTLRDLVIAGGLAQDEHTDTTWAKLDQTQRGSVVTSSTSAIVGTELSGASPPDCRNASDRRATRGPGKGDLFVLAANTPLVYWNTENLSNSRHLLPSEPLPPNLSPQDQPQTVSVYGYQLQGTPVGLPEVLRSKSRQDLDEILRLDPLAGSPKANANAPITAVPHVGLPASRYVFLQAQGLGADVPLLVKREVLDQRYSTKTVTEKRSKHKGEVEEDATAIYANKMLQFGTRALLGAATGGASEYLFQIEASREQCKADPSSGACNDLKDKESVTSDIQDAIKEGAMPTFFQDRTETRVDEVLTESNAVARSNQAGNVQSFFVRDPSRSIDLGVYYDLLFGTFAFEERPAAMGTLATSTRAALSSAGIPKGQSAWVKTVAANLSTTIDFPDPIRSQLSSYTRGRPFALKALDSQAFTAGDGKTAGLPQGVAVGAQGLSSNTNAAPGVYQQAFLVQDDQGTSGGVLWQTVIVSAPGAYDQATCDYRPNDELPGTSIATCCTPAGQCDSFVAPQGGIQHIEAESFASTSGLSSSPTNAGSLDDGDWARYGAVDFGPYEGIYRSIRARVKVSAPGAIELWADGLPAQGGTLLGNVPVTAPGTSCGTGAGDGTVVVEIAPTTTIPGGVHDIYAVVRAPNGPLGELDWIEFGSDAAQPPPLVRMQGRVADLTSQLDNHVRPTLRLVNDGPVPVDLSRVTARYWYTVDQGSPQEFHVDWAAIGNNRVLSRFVALALPREGADTYAEIGFTPQACALAVGESTGELKLRWNKTNWTNYDERNDHSQLLAGVASDAPTITVYVDGKLVWGTEPLETAGAEQSASGKMLRVQYREAGGAASGDNHIRPHFNIVNDGTVDVPLSDLSLRYWFTSDGSSALQSWIDYAVVGGQNLETSFVSLPSGRVGADRYFEIRFKPSAGTLGPFAATGEIQSRFNKSDWSNFDELNDHSFSPVRSSFADWTGVTLYRNGILIWGTEP